MRRRRGGAEEIKRIRRKIRTGSRRRREENKNKNKEEKKKKRKCSERSSVFNCILI
jgi:hypothetical protein